MTALLGGHGLEVSSHKEHTQSPRSTVSTAVSPRVSSKHIGHTKAPRACAYCRGSRREKAKTISHSAVVQGNERNCCRKRGWYHTKKAQSRLKRSEQLQSCDPSHSPSMALRTSAWDSWALPLSGEEKHQQWLYFSAEHGFMVPSGLEPCP